MKPADQLAELELPPEPGDALATVLRRADNGHVLMPLLALDGGYVVRGHSGIAPSTLKH